MIKPQVQDSINAQIVNELYASNAYLSVAAYMDGQGLKVLAAFFFRQSDEERMHATKLLHYLLDVQGDVKIGAVPAPPLEFASVEAAIAASLEQEITVTNQINAMMTIAHETRDYATASFLKWFVDEQVEEQSSMSDLLQLVRRAGPHNLLLVEDRLMKQGVNPVGLANGAEGGD